MLTDAVTTPGAASAAVGVSSMAATKTPFSFMTNVLLLRVRTRQRNGRSRAKWSHSPKGGHAQGPPRAFEMMDFEEFNLSNVLSNRSPGRYDAHCHSGGVIARNDD
jgi:hypothetical protein